MTRPLALTLVAILALLGICLVRYAPPTPLAADAPPERFSALRAREVQRAIAGDGVPRDVGSDANAKARAFLRGELDKSGFATELQTAMSCSRHGACARVTNVVATRAGREPEAASVLLMAHYDSVPCSPGASDDGMGTATVIETARALGAAGPLRRTVVVVLADGEEAGLLGATAFMEQHPLAKKVRGAVNVDARGSSGPSAMFETSTGNAWIVGLYAKNVERPVTSSLFYEIYRRMPNDTDFTTVKAEAQGVNLANIASIENYHTPLDSLEHASAGTLQHHGEQALAMVKALGESGAELERGAGAGSGADAVWFDVLAMFIVRWPAAASTGLACAAFALVLGWTIRFRAWGVALVAPLAALVAAALAALLVGGLLRMTGAIPVPWVAHPVLVAICLYGASITAGLVVTRAIAGDARAEVLWAGTWLLWGALGIAAAVVAPGASFLFVVPALVAGFAAWARIEVAAAVAVLAAAVLWMPIAVLVHDGLGFAVPVVACLPGIVLVSALGALRAGAGARRAFAAAVGVAVAVGAASIVPKYSVERPQRVNVVFRQDEGAGAAHLYVEAAWAYMPWGEPPRGMMTALGPRAASQVEAPLPMLTAVPYAEVPRVEMAAPRATIVASSSGFDGWRVRVRLESPRGARTIVLVLPPARVVDVVVDGIEARPRSGAVVFRGVPKQGIEVALHAVGREPIPVTLVDVTSGLPPAGVAKEAAAVRDARPAEATQTQEGDVTLVARRVDL